MGGNRAVVDDAPATRCLRLHPAKGFLGAEKRACEICIDHPLPLLDGQFIQSDWWRARPRIVEQHVDASERLDAFAEEVAYLPRIGDVGDHGEDGSVLGAATLRGLLQIVRSP